MFSRLGRGRPTGGLKGCWPARGDEEMGGCGGARCKPKGSREKKKKRKKETDKKIFHMSFKIFFFKFIARQVLVKMFKNLILCHVNNLSTIHFNKKISFLIFKITWL